MFLLWECYSGSFIEGPPMLLVLSWARNKRGSAQAQATVQAALHLDPHICQRCLKRPRQTGALLGASESPVGESHRRAWDSGAEPCHPLWTATLL